MTQVNGIIIDEHGFLEIKRGNSFVEQICPYSSLDEGRKRCGDSCPKFSEPTKVNKALDDWSVDMNLYVYILNICGTEIECLDKLFFDKRSTMT